MGIVDWLSDPANWSGAGSIPYQIMIHLVYSLVALAIAAAIAIPLGTYVGHTGKGENFIMGSANAMRALPTLGLLILLVLVIAPTISSNLAFVIPSLIVLVLLAVPPILSGLASGIRAIDRSVIDAARGMGFSTAQIVTRVELPCALPLALSGIRGATLQVVSTATVAAYVSLDGLGRFIIDGRAGNDYAQMAGGSLVLALLAILLETVFAFVGVVAISPGLSRRLRETPPVLGALPRAKKLG
ncbi:ABC transporter permease subunit [Glutamicibacter sp. PS]|uniref:ABC transporter permease n=1 Tax=Glutamicibacter sp. PS TaxID=3075634 RepID=UPI0028456AEC|nr:ABC transporter permease subunit [Glutamicibacter sp. PS]MDR4532631.1 ABC transporter permease subunit [Glutamicibacter sp. PS]